MKKVYSVLLLMVTLGAPTVKSQITFCAGANAKPVTSTSSCYVAIQGAPVGAQIAVFDAGGDLLTLPGPIVGSDGVAIAGYDCSKSPSLVIATRVDGTECRIFVAPEAGLPIKIKSFTAQTQNENAVLLRWTSVFEANASKYVVQKSTDGRNFSDISEVKAAGNSTTTLNYSYSDKQMANGTAYYRLKLIDFDGTIDYSKIIYINNGEVGLLPLSVFPNPFRAEVQLKGVTTSEVNRKNVKVYNAMGSEVNYRVVGGNSIIIDPSVSKGVYVLRVKGQAYKLFKE